MFFKKVFSSPFLYAAFCIIFVLFSTIYVVNAQTTSGGTPACYDKHGIFRILPPGEVCDRNETSIVLQTGDSPSGELLSTHYKTYEFDMNVGDTFTFPVPQSDEPIFMKYSVTNFRTVDDAYFPAPFRFAGFTTLIYSENSWGRGDNATGGQVLDFYQGETSLWNIFNIAWYGNSRINLYPTTPTASEFTIEFVNNGESENSVISTPHVVLNIWY